jgi:transmembrane sensor
MTARKPNQDIDDVAVAWAARQDRAPLSPDEERALKAWLDEDPRHAGAFLRARAVAMRSLSARALGTRYDPADFGGVERLASPSRRQILAWSGAAAASAAAVVVMGVSLQAPQAHATARGEIRLVPLADGSTVMLNTDTTVRVKYDRAHRFASLVEGEADFTVLADPQRPFIVEVGGRRLSTASGAFRVRKLKDQPLDVLVYSGLVDVASQWPSGPQRPVILGADMRLVAPVKDGGNPSPMSPKRVSPSEVRRELAWREGKIAFEGETLAQASASFARYSDTHIVVEDPALAREPVVGLFAVNDPVGFSHAIADAFGATVRTRDGVVVLQRPAAGE